MTFATLEADLNISRDTDDRLKINVTLVSSTPGRNVWIF